MYVKKLILLLEIYGYVNCCIARKKGLQMALLMLGDHFIESFSFFLMIGLCDE